MKKWGHATLYAYLKTDALDWPGEIVLPLLDLQENGAELQVQVVGPFQLPLKQLTDVLQENIIGG